MKTLTKPHQIAKAQIKNAKWIHLHISTNPNYWYWSRVI